MKIAHRSSLAALALVCATATVTAAQAGDPDHGAKLYNQCKACHAIVRPDGTAIVRGGRVGPDLYGIIGRPVASLPGYPFSAALKSNGDAGMVWTEALISEYITNPSAFVEDHGGTGTSKMLFRVRSGGDDIAAYLASVK